MQTEVIPTQDIWHRERKLQHRESKTIKSIQQQVWICSRNNAISNLNSKWKQKHTEKGKHIYPNRTRAQNSHENVLNACNPKDFNRADFGLPEMSPSSENLFKAKFSKMHNFKANHLLKSFTVNMENVKQWAILDSGAKSNFLMIGKCTHRVN